jgi:hypothetical protein
VAYTLEGLENDNLKYRLQTGPTEMKNLKLMFMKEPDENILKALCEFQFLADIDLSETDISFAEHLLSKWSRTKFEKVKLFLEKLPPKLAQG